MPILNPVALAGRTPAAADDGPVATGPSGQRAHHLALQQAERLAGRLYAVGPGVWTCVGNGLSNQTFIEGPGGLIAIDKVGNKIRFYDPDTLIQAAEIAAAAAMMAVAVQRKNAFYRGALVLFRALRRRCSTTGFQNARC